MDLIALLVQSGNINAIDDHGKTLLHYAYCRENEGLIAYLLANGSNPKIKDKDGRIPIMELAGLKKQRINTETYKSYRRAYLSERRGRKEIPSADYAAQEPSLS